MTMKLGVFMVLTVAASGCLGFGEDGGADAALVFDGDDAGEHSQNAECDDQGTIRGSGNIADGEVTITLRDASGTSLFHQTFDGEFSFAEKTVSGAGGDWNIHAQRNSNDIAGDAFGGSYEFYLDC